MALAHDRYLVTGCSDNELRFFALRSTATVGILPCQSFLSFRFSG